MVSLSGEGVTVQGEPEVTKAWLCAGATNDVRLERASGGVWSVLTLSGMFAVNSRTMDASLRRVL